MPEQQQGIVVANDADTDRAYMLVHQCRRINSPLLMITTHQGQSFPRIDDLDACAAVHTVNSSSSSSSESAQVLEKQLPLSVFKADMAGFFDRVLCDVPCSGDGTLRKSPNIWEKWTTNSAFQLHPLQLAISKRGAQLCKTGALMVYSTCSMSPIENEAVVAELIRSSQGRLELIDARQFLPLFTARPGMSEWHVLDDAPITRPKKQLARSQASHRLAGRVGREGEPKPADSMELAVTSADAGGDAGSADSEFKEIDSATDSKVDGEADVAANVIPTPFVPAPNDEVAACMAMGFKYYPSWEFYEALPENAKPAYIRQSFFPPTPEERKSMHLERCLRCVPHDMDTGGFFVATLRKLPKPTKTSSGSSETTTTLASFEVSEIVAVACDEGVVTTGTVGGTTEGEAVTAAEAQSLAQLAREEKERNRREANLRQKGCVDFHAWDLEHFNKLAAFYGFAETLPPDSM